MLRAGQVIDRYTVDQLLGSGGMAVVYRVRHNQLGSFHALKVLTHTSPGIHERLLQEGRVQASLRHPNVVAVTDVIDVDGAPGLVMEYVDGPALDAWLSGHRPDLDTAERLFRGIVAGVAAAHAQGLVHRDLKPANVMLAPQSAGQMLPKVADFGLAKALFAEESGPHATRSGVTMGTPAYMAPEQIRDAKNVDHRADVFSLGCMLYELVCGRPPFVGPDLLSIFNAVATGSFPPAASLVPDLPPRIHRAIHGALTVEKERRIQDCTGLLYVLDGHEPEAAPAPTPPEPQPTLAPEPGATFDADALDLSEPPAASVPPPRRRRWFLLGVVLPLGILLVLGGTLLTLGRFGAAAWERRVRHAVAEGTGGQLTWKMASIRPGAVLLGDVVLLGEDGEPVARAARVRVGGWWHLKGGIHLAPTDLEADGLRLYPRRTADGWVLPDRAIALLRDRGGDQGVHLRRIATGPIGLRGAGSTGTLQGYIGGVELDDVVLLPPGGAPWTAADLSVGSITLKAPDPVLQVKRVEYDAGVLTVDDLKAAVRVRQDGLLDLPPLLADLAPGWLGGLHDDAGDAPWLGIDPRVLPVPAKRVEVTSGTLQIFDWAHTPKTQEWDLDLDRVTLGPYAAPWLPLDGAGRIEEAPVMVQGDLRADGLVRGRAGVRHLPLGSFTPYMGAGLRRLVVEPSGGTLSGTLDFTLKDDSFAGRLDGEADDVAFVPAASPEGSSGPPAGAAALAPTRDRVPLSAQVEGSLADADFHPLEELVQAVSAALLAPAAALLAPAGNVASAPRSGRARSHEVLDRFRREVREALDEYRPAPAAPGDPPPRQLFPDRR